MEEFLSLVTRGPDSLSGEFFCVFCSHAMKTTSDMGKETLVVFVLFCFCGGVGFEFRDLCLLGRNSTI
jgi:hypothetical protein